MHSNARIIAALLVAVGVSTLHGDARERFDVDGISPASLPKLSLQTLMTLASLTRSADVQQELKLSQDQVKRVAALTAEVTQARRQSKRVAGAHPDDLRKANEAAVQQYQQLLAILDKRQVERLFQIHLQQLGVNALALPEVDAVLCLSQAQRDQIGEFKEQLNSELRSAIERMQRDEVNANRVQNYRTALAEAQQRFVDRCQGALSPTQRKLLEQLQGEAFTGTLAASTRGLPAAKQAEVLQRAKLQQAQRAAEK